MPRGIRALDALAAMAGNPRVDSLMHSRGQPGDTLSEAVRQLVRASAVTPRFPNSGDLVLVPNPDRPGGPGIDHTAWDYEHAPFADVWRIEHRSRRDNKPMDLRWFGTIQLQETARLPPENDLLHQYQRIQCQLNAYIGVKKEANLYRQILQKFPGVEIRSTSAGEHRNARPAHGGGSQPSVERSRPSQGGWPTASTGSMRSGWQDSSHLGKSDLVDSFVDRIDRGSVLQGRGPGARGKGGGQEEAGTAVIQAFLIYDLDDKLHVAQTKKDIGERMRKVQGLVRMTSALKQETVLRDLEFRAEQVHSTLRGRMYNSCGDQLAGFEDLHQLPQIWDLPICKNQETLAAFFHLEGYQRMNWTGMSLVKFIAKDREIDLGWGQEAKRPGRSLLLTCVKRLQEALVVLFDRQFDRALEPFDELLEAGFQQHMNGFLRYYIEKLVASFMICVREEKRPDTPGFEQWRMSNPGECAALLRAYSENLMFRFGSKRYSAGVGPDKLLELPPHTFFFGSEGPWVAVTQPASSKPAVVSPAPRNTETPRGVLDEVAGLKRTLERVTQELAEAKTLAKAQKVGRQDVCLDFLAEKYGVKAGPANTPWTCRLGTECPKSHPSDKAEGWKRVKRTDWVNWGVANSVRAKLVDLVPNFDESWA